MNNYQFGIEKKKKEVVLAIVDDNELTRNTIVNVLEKANYKIGAVAGTFEQAKEILANNKCNIFLIDVIMPHVSGMELAKLITEKLRDTYIIMMSSLQSEGMVVDAISNGAIDFLHKPFTVDDLLQSVAKAAHLIENES